MSTSIQPASVDGSEFTGLNEAEAEAAQCARDLMAAGLKRGNPVPSSWRMLIATEDDTVLRFLPFSVVARGTSEISERQLIEPAFATRPFNENKTVEPPAADVTYRAIGLEARTLMRQSIADIRGTINQTRGVITNTRKALLRANELLLASPPAMADR